MRSVADSEETCPHPSARTVDHSAQRNNDYASGTAPESVAPDVQSQLLQEVLRTLKESTRTLKESTIAQESGTDTRSRFWATYKRHAEDYDSEFLEKYKDDMDIVLIFSGLFSAVSTSFITGMQSSLSPDPTDTTNALLRQLIQATNSSAFAGQSVDPPSWNGPGTTVIWTQSLLYASLCASLLAALGAVLGKQWLGHYRRRGSGTIEERGKRRQQKLSGLEAWHFHAVLAVLPVLLQISLLLFGVALSAYVWTEQSTIGAVVIGTTAFGIVFYFSITLASLISPNCPFQTPVSSVLPVLLQLVFRLKNMLRLKEMLHFKVMHLFKVMLRFKDNVVAYFNAKTKIGVVIVIVGIILFPVTLIIHTRVIYRYWVAPRAGPLLQMVLRRPRAKPNLPGDPESSPASSSPLAPDPLKLHIPSLPIDLQGALSIQWLLETSTDPDVIATAAGMVPEVEWPVELDLLGVFGQLQETFKGCFVPVPNDSNQWKLAPFGQERALIFGKAIVHLYCNRFYSDMALIDRAGHDQLSALFASLEHCDTKGATSSFVCAIARLSLSVGEKGYRDDTQMWHEELPPVPESCRTWVLRLFPHLLAHPLCPPTLKLMAMGEITRWITSPFPPRNILADCVLSAAILIGVPVDQKELVKVDKSSAIELLLEQLQQHLPTLSDMRDTRYVSVPALYARPLLQMLSCLLETETLSRFGTCESKSCGCGVAEWGLRVCDSWMGQITRAARPKEDPIRLAMLGCARAALHISVVAYRAAHGPVNCGRWQLSHSSHLGQPITENFHWALDFLNHHYGTRDNIAVADTFLMLSQASDISCWANNPVFIEAIIVAMRSDKPTHVRHLALRTAWKIREALGSPDNTILPLLPAFSDTLRSAVLTNIHSERDTTTSNSPDRFFYEERDLHYVQIIYTLVRSSGGIWDRHLHDDQHFNRCLSIAKHLRFQRCTAVAAYLAAIVENLEERGAKHNFTNDDIRPLIADGWDVVKHVTRDLEEILEALTAFTQRYRDAGGRLPDYVSDHVLSTLKRLKRAQPRSPVIGSLNKLLVWLRTG